jgi:UDP-N-acetylmuramate--alanine ligase
VQKIHFVGIGGVGMCGIAEVLHNLEFDVSGSDIAEGANTRRLSDLGVRINIGHSADHIVGVDVVVVSTAVDETNPEVMAAKAQKIPVIPRAEMLGELMQLQRGIAIAGTHGKTTTTSLVASLLAEGGLDPTFVIGGRLNSAGTNARLGHGEYLVAEADESDASFMHLHPLMSVVTNIDADHLSAYGGNFSILKQAFIDFVHNIPFYGVAIMCVDDPVVREILPHIHKPVLTYGTGPTADLRAGNITQQGSNTSFTVSLRDKQNWLQVTLNQPGKHNVLNAVAAIAVAHELGVNDKAIVKALGEFGGIARRFQINGEVAVNGNNVLFVDDYAHHPREIAVTLEAARNGWPDRRLVVVFHPHRYSRTHDLLDDFGAVFSDQDPLVVTEVYAAGESVISGADGRALCRTIRARGLTNPVFVEGVDLLPGVLGGLLKDGDLLLTLGAGNIGQVAATLPQQRAGAA